VSREVSEKEEAKVSKQECALCGYDCEEYYRYAVPLASPPQETIICADCAEEIAEWLAARKAENDRGS
jgi:hypothetical protein